MPLLPLVTDDSRRLAAASLSHCFPGPHGLVRRLAEEDVSISAPLLVASSVLTDIDLIGLIGRHGLAHAGAIARRRNLNPNIVALIRALGVGEFGTEIATTLAIEPPANGTVAEAEARPRAHVGAGAASEPVADAFDTYMAAAPGAAEEAARDALRAMMQPAGDRTPSRAHAPAARHRDWAQARAATARVVDTGLTGRAALFHTAIADAFDLDFPTAVDIAEDSNTRRLAVALKAVELPRADAYLIAALAFPPCFATTSSIRNFIELYAALDVDASRQEVIGWRNDSEDLAMQAPANSDRYSPVPDRARLTA